MLKKLFLSRVLFTSFFFFINIYEFSCTTEARLNRPFFPGLTSVSNDLDLKKFALESKSLLGQYLLFAPHSSGQGSQGWPAFSQEVVRDRRWKLSFLETIESSVSSTLLSGKRGFIEVALALSAIGLVLALGQASLFAAHLIAREGCLRSRLVPLE